MPKLEMNYKLAAILALAFALRIAGVHFGLPHLYHADEPIVVNHALAYGTGDLNPHFFKIPPLVSYLLFACYGIYFLTGRGLGLFQSVQDFEYLFYGDPSSFYLIARIIFGVLAGTFTVYLLYRLVLKFFDPVRALLSALFLSVCFLHVRDSHYIYADTPLVLVLVVSFFVILKIVKGDASRAAAVQAGALIGLAAAVKYNGAALAIPYLAACCLNPKALRNVAFAALAAILTFCALNPYAILDSSFFIREIIQQSKSNTGVSWAHHFSYSLNGAAGPVMLAAGCLGILRLLFRWDPAKGILGLFCAAYYLILVRAGQPYDRYVLPMMPFLLFFAADFLIAAAERFPRFGSVILILGSLASAGPSFAASAAFDRLMMAKDVRTLAKNWTEENVPAGSKIALGRPFYMPRLNFFEEQLREKLEQLPAQASLSEGQKRKLEFLAEEAKQNPRARYELYFLAAEDERDRRFLFSIPVLPYDIDVLRERGVQYVILDRAHPVEKHESFYKSLEGRAALIAEFNPYRNPEIRWPIDRQPLTGGPFLLKDLLQRERNGNPVRIYRLQAN